MQIHAYAKQGNIQGVAKELAQGVAIDCVDQDQPRTPLMCAVASQKADIEMIRFLVENGADLNAVESEFQQTVLGLGIQSGNLAKIQFLLDSGADINYQRPHGYDALIDVMHDRDLSQDPDLLTILRVLLKNGAKVDGISSYQETALKVASRIGRFDAVQLLLTAGCDRQQLKWTPLMWAIVFGSFQDVKNLLEHCTNVS
jgi:ankyrin repeat protein